MSAIELIGLKKTYRSRRSSQEALKGIDLTVEEGEVFGFIGPNGAGKSTTIKILLGLTRPTEGEARIFGHSCQESRCRSMLGYLPEVATYHEFMSADELLRVHAHLSGLPANEHQDRCAEVLELVGLKDRRGDRIKEFSKGMKQRFGIAQALIARPKLLILDELTSGLDPLAQAELMGILTDLKSQGITIFFSSHHMTEIENVCDSAAIIHLGLIRRCGKMEDLLGQDSFTIRYSRDGEVNEEKVEASLAQTRLGELTAEGSTVLDYRADRGRLADLFHEVAAA